jgi:hypothetical protein
VSVPEPQAFLRARIPDARRAGSRTLSHRPFQYGGDLGSDSQGIEVVFRCTIALCFLVAVLRVWLLLLPAMFEELDKFIKRLARP